MRATSPVCSQPSASIACRREVGAVAVAGHDERAADEQLAVVGDPQLHAVDRLADRAEARRARAVGGDDARGLAHAPHLADRHAARGEELEHLDRRGRRADRQPARLVETRGARAAASGGSAAAPEASSAALSFSHTRGTPPKRGRPDLGHDGQDLRRVRHRRHGVAVGHERASSASPSGRRRGPRAGRRPSARRSPAAPRRGRRAARPACWRGSARRPSAARWCRRCRSASAGPRGPPRASAARGRSPRRRRSSSSSSTTRTPSPAASRTTSAKRGSATTSRLPASPMTKAICSAGEVL